MRYFFACQPTHGPSRLWAGASASAGTELSEEVYLPTSTESQPRVLISGATGLIGRALIPALRNTGWHITTLTRQQAGPDAILWHPSSGELNPRTVTGFDAVVHLAGEPVGTGRWTAEKMHRIFVSRVRGTETLATALANAEQPPPVFISASGINVYGNRGDALLTEDEPRGKCFLAEVCEAWEAAAEPLQTAGTRTVQLRIGPVLSTEGGMLAELLPLFRLGLGGPIGGGRAYISWVTLRDVVRGIEHALRSDRLHGPVNMVGPQPVRNSTFTASLGRALHRPAIIPVPAWAIRLAFGQMGEETVLSSVRAVPERLLQDGFTFKDPQLDEALRLCLQSKA